MTWRHPVYPVNDKSTPDNMICQNCGVQSDCHVRPVKRADDSWSECADFPAPGFPKYLERVDWNFNVQLEEQRKRIDFVSRERDTLKEQMHQVSSWNMKLQAERELLCAEKAELSRQRDAARASVCNHDTTEITQLRARKEMDRQAIEALMAVQREFVSQIALLKEINGQLKLGNQMLLNDSQNKIDAVAERTEQRDMARNSLAVWVQREADAQREIARLRGVCCRPLPDCAHYPVKEMEVLRGHIADLEKHIAGKTEAAKRAQMSVDNLKKEVVRLQTGVNTEYDRAEKYKATIQKGASKAFAVVMKTAYEDFTSRQGCAPVPKWQPIVTAPKDGQSLLMAHHRDGAFVGKWSRECEKWCVVAGDSFAEPSYWMPLPEAPK